MLPLRQSKISRERGGHAVRLYDLEATISNVFPQNATIRGLSLMRGRLSVPFHTGSHAIANIMSQTETVRLRSFGSKYEEFTI